MQCAGRRPYLNDLDPRPVTALHRGADWEPRRTCVEVKVSLPTAWQKPVQTLSQKERDSRCSGPGGSPYVRVRTSLSQCGPWNCDRGNPEKTGTSGRLEDAFLVVNKDMIWRQIWLRRIGNDSWSVIERHGHGHSHIMLVAPEL